MTATSAKVIWFWQRIVSPHMAGLAVALLRQGCEVVYVAEKRMSEERARQGWAPPFLGGVRLELASSTAELQALISSAPSDSVHICQGIRGNGLVGIAQVALARRGLRQWVVMETVEDSNWRGILKRLEYRRLFWQWRSHQRGVLAIGHSTPTWVAKRGMPDGRVFPFAYFLSLFLSEIPIVRVNEGRFRVVFVGQFINLKRLDLLISALALLNNTNVELVVIGSGPLKNELFAMAETALPGRINLIGRLPVDEVPGEVAKADCLVLPSRYDGWGAVVSESLMVGTPAICSDRCGSATVVRASGYGGVFRSGDIDDLVVTLERTVSKGRLLLGERLALVDWAKCLGADAGANYLLNILEHADGRLGRPLPPWEIS
ncbi:glycosyltransferase [Desulfoluna limicola]|uniref:glycosyltransferase n=1 Tax=Desulfoluna limicola TaxID=2810562 RepID=UPI001F44E5AA|nr:glycosyltransferase [Desulfoluna limicola]